MVACRGPTVRSLRGRSWGVCSSVFVELRPKKSQLRNSSVRRCFRGKQLAPVFTYKGSCYFNSDILLKELIKQHFGIGISISTSISIRKVINIYHESPYEMQTEMSREKAEDEAQHPPTQPKRKSWMVVGRCNPIQKCQHFSHFW